MSNSVHLQIALRREKPYGRTHTSPLQDVSKMDSSDDEDEVSPSQAAAISDLFPTPKNYDPAPDVRILQYFAQY